MIAGLLDHLWQSSLFAGLVAILALLLRRQPAGLRYRLWFLASLKFLVPFAPLAALGAQLSEAAPRAAAPLLTLQPVAERLAAPAGAVPLPAHDPAVLAWLAGAWLLGSMLVLTPRLVAATRLSRVSRAAQVTGVDAPIAVKASASLLEPGLVGLRKPAVLVPTGLLAHLSAAELDAILAHELGHFRRRDNLTAGLHMLVETLFWFAPPVWLIGARLLAERERACDEGVLAQGHDANVYAGAILKACRFCIASPLSCAPGVTGALTARIGHILAARAAEKLDAGRAAATAVALAAALVLPLLSGLTPLAPLAPLAHVAAVERRTEQVVIAAAAQMVAAPVVRLTARRLPHPKFTFAAVLPDLPPQEPAPQAAPPPAQQAAPAPTPLVPAVLARTEVAPAPPPRTVLNPRGNGAPEEVVCRAPETLPGSRLPGPVICNPNRVWAALYARHLDISEDGKVLLSHAPGNACASVPDLHQRGNDPITLRTPVPLNAFCS